MRISAVFFSYYLVCSISFIVYISFYNRLSVAVTSSGIGSGTAYLLPGGGGGGGMRDRI